MFLSNLSPQTHTQTHRERETKRGKERMIKTTGEKVEKPAELMRNTKRKKLPQK